MISIKSDSRILFLGDSITDIKFNRRFNHSLHGKNIYTLQLSSKLKKKSKDLKFFYRGIASNRTYHLYDRLTKDCINLKPDAVIMLIGVNDAWEHYVPEQYPPLKRPMQPHIDKIYRRLKTELDDVIIISLLPFMIDSVEEKLPFHKILDEYRDTLRKTALKNGAYVIDLKAEFNTAQKSIQPCKLAADGIYPTFLGHKVIADALLREIELI
ncbi:MAG: GDSL-type esterase/lipase family protein [Clostridiales bacterium]|nr:GDSL-type esterase/lipase family protein [Clostridiales bacterium]